MKQLIADLLRVLVRKLDPPVKASDDEEPGKSSVPMKPGEIGELGKPTNLQSDSYQWPFYNGGMYL